MEGKEKRLSRSQKFSKSLRLKKKSEFKFARFKRVKTKHFVFVMGSEGKGRLGVSLSKKVLKSAVARNRIRRLLREAFRINVEVFDRLDVNVLGLEALTKDWKSLTYSEVEAEVLQTRKQG